MIKKSLFILIALFFLCNCASLTQKNSLESNENKLANNKQEEQRKLSPDEVLYEKEACFKKLYLKYNNKIGRLSTILRTRTELKNDNYKDIKVGAIRDIKRYNYKYVDPKELEKDLASCESIQ